MVNEHAIVYNFHPYILLTVTVHVHTGAQNTGASSPLQGMMTFRDTCCSDVHAPGLQMSQAFYTQPITPLYW